MFMYHEKLGNKNLIYVYLIIILLSFITVLVYLNFKYPNNGYSESIPVTPVASLYYAFFIWQHFNYSGLITPIGGILFYPYAIILTVVGKLAGLFSETLFALFIPMLIFTIGIFTLVYFLTYGKSDNLRIFGGLISVIFIIGNFMYIRLYSQLAFIPWSILFIILLMEKIKKNETIEMYVFICTLVIATDLAFAGYIMGINSFFALFLIGFLALLLNNRGSYIKSIKYIFIVFALALLINFSLILSVYLVTTNTQFTSSYSNIASGNIHLIKLYQNNIIIELLSFLPIPVISSSINQIVNFGIKLIYTVVYLEGLSIFVLTVIGMSYQFSEVQKKNVKNFTYLFNFAIFSVFIILIITGLSYYPPFGILFHSISELLYKITSLNILYVLGLQFLDSPVIFTAILILFSIAIIELLDRLKAKRILTILFVILFFMIIIMYLYTEGYLPYMYGLPYTNSSLKIGVSIPSDSFNIARFINSHSGYYSIITLPQEVPGTYSGFQLDTWYSGPNIYSELIPTHPVYSGWRGYNPYTQFFFPYSMLESYYINNRIEYKDMPNRNISNGLGIFGIRYIIIQGNALHKSNIEYENAPNFSFKTIYTNLNNSKNIYFVEKFGNSSVYENNNYLSLIYISNIKIISNPFISQISNVIENRSFNIHNISTYSSNIIGFYNDSHTINATPIANFSKIILPSLKVPYFSHVKRKL